MFGFVAPARSRRRQVIVVRPDEWLLLQGAAILRRPAKDPIGYFLAECTAPALGHRIQSLHLYRAYKSWAARCDEEPWSIRTFVEALRQKGLMQTKSSRVYWLDVMLTVPVSCVDRERSPPLRS